MRIVARAALGIAIAGTVLGGATAAFGSIADVKAEIAEKATTAPAPGTIVVYSPQKDSIHGTITITGAIGDYGTSTAVNKSGKPAQSGGYVKITLHKGAFEINTTAFNTQAAKVQPTIDDATCSASASATGPATIFNGTGLYKGIAGTLTITAFFGLISQTAKSGAQKGQCSGKPLNQYMVISGSGSITFG